MDKNQIQARLRKLNIHPKKSLGQNFLINPLSIQRIISAIEHLKPKRLVEVGPGIGSLTESLISLNLPLTLIELDKDIYNYWLNRKINIVLSDVLKIKPSFFKANSTLTGNLPYNIASTLVVQSSQSWNHVQNMLLMLQKEVSQRLLAFNGTKSFGFLSVIAQTYWSMQGLFEVPSSDFYPLPKVDGMVVQFKRKPIPNLDHTQFILFVKQCFLQKRKLLLTKLKKQMGTKVLNIFSELQINPKARAEDLTSHQYMDLYRKLF